MTDPKITHTIVFVTPEMARRWLESNRNNRKIRESRVLKYREDMETGRWQFTGEAIQFDRNEDLSNGQHRLTALAEAQVDGIWFLVIRGLPPEAQGAMDQGAKRTAGDQLAIFGTRNASNIASAVKQYLIRERGLLFRDSTLLSEISTPAIEQWVRSNPDRVEHLNDNLQQVRRSGGRPMVAGAAFLILADVDSSDAEEFFRLLATGGGYEGDPINTLSQRLLRDKSRRVSPRDELALFFQAWNAWREGRTVSKFQRPRGGRYTESNFPEPR